ncbi:F0F1 ATP synthase subunit A [Clostridium estertheticum]|uniref:F0F1 ATP synthase subunit A n=1 Tax=Clostridium estertheticum TaxID=238834 RepID=UPI0013E98878|nr:F0F1 ATP synthase subunit A [Clostridium estertheticum]MBZ9685064.1 F0F1 ATP synthase subunit A [Clostridium estertheticum]
MEKIYPLFHIRFFGYNIGIAQSVVVQWVIIVLVAMLCIYFTRDLKIIPNKKQNIIEIVMDSINNLVRDNMGEDYMGFVPFIATFAIFLTFMNNTGLIGIRPPTVDYSVALALALITFVVVQGFAIKKIGLGHYFKGYTEPYAFILPINLIERVMLPISLSFRLFGNMIAGVVIIDLAYKSLASLTVFAQLIIPVPLHFYFDLFDGMIQMVIFVMLTMVNIKVIAEH